MRYLSALALLFALSGVDALAQGIIIDRVIIEPTPRPPRPRRQRWPMRLKEHRVDIRIEDQAARTEVVQIFHNPNPWPIEGIYLFPLPDHASVSRFTMRMGNKDITGEILDAKRARDIYRSIVHRRRDPGLLEYAGRRLLRARLFPIPARGDTKVTLRYEELLEPVGGVLELSYPLRSDKFAPGPVKVSGRIEVTAKAGVATLFSPTHKLDVVKKSDTHAIASFEEARSRADRDLRVLYGLGRKDFGLSLATHRPAGEDGYFLMLLAPNEGGLDKTDVLPKDIVFVLDTSGSMGDRGGKKLTQAKAALSYALGRLHERDRFNVISFATEARPFRDGVLPANKENVAAALEYVKKLEATGGTAIHDALLSALDLERTDGRVPLVFFLTDGMPTIGPTDTGRILDAVKGRNAAQARLFVFGVGDDVNATLLTGLSDKNRGTSHFVSENENIEIKVSALYDKVASPVLTDVRLEIDGLGEYDVYPRRIGDLFKGQQVTVVGRYKKQGPRAVALTGRVGKKELRFVYEGTFGSEPGREYLPRLWAVRKVGFLLDEIRNNGEKAELVEEVKTLGTRHGIVTPYTSFLVVEEGEMLRRRARSLRGRLGAPEDPGAGAGGDAGGVRLRERLSRLEAEKDDADEARAALEKKKEAGKGAVAGARITARLATADRAGGHVGTGVKTVGAKTFRFRNGVWTDNDLAAFRAKNAEARVVRVEYLGEEFDKLLENAQLARLLSVGERVTFVFDGVIYETTSK